MIIIKLKSGTSMVKACEVANKFMSLLEELVKIKGGTDKHVPTIYWKDYDKCSTTQGKLESSYPTSGMMVVTLEEDEYSVINSEVLRRISEVRNVLVSAVKEFNDVTSFIAVTNGFSFEASDMLLLVASSPYDAAKAMLMSVFRESYLVEALQTYILLLAGFRVVLDELSNCIESLLKSSDGAKAALESKRCKLVRKDNIIILERYAKEKDRVYSIGPCIYGVLRGCIGGLVRTYLTSLVAR